MLSLPYALLVCPAYLLFSSTLVICHPEVDLSRQRHSLRRPAFSTPWLLLQAMGRKRTTPAGRGKLAHENDHDDNETFANNAVILMPTTDNGEDANRKALEI